MQASRMDRGWKAFRRAGAVLTAAVLVGGALDSLARTGEAGEALPAKVTQLPRPPFTYSYHLPSGGGKAGLPRVRLTQLSARKNQITDQDAWLRANGLSLPTLESDLPQGDRGRIPAGAPDSFMRQRLVRAIKDQEYVHLIYGPDFSGGRYLLLFDPLADESRFALDFFKYIRPPLFVPGDRSFVDEGIQWAQERDGVLYVSNFHRTYARSSKGQNGYLTAVDLKTGDLRWRSRPLVCNTQNFAISGDVLFTGYGFTAEPDFVYVLDRKTGALVQTLPVKSGPEYVFVKGNRLLVRCYDTDYVFRISR